MVKWMIDANNASNVISEEKRTPYAAMTHLLMAAILHFSGTEGNFIDIYINN